jgi:hypothetical protein
LPMLRKTESLDGLPMSLEFLRRQVAPFGTFADISCSLEQGRGNDDRAMDLPAQPFKAFGDVHSIADDRIFEKLLIAQCARKNLSVMCANANGDRRSPRPLPFQRPACRCVEDIKSTTHSAPGIVRPL